MEYQDAISIILVHYFTPDLVKECGAALRADLDSSGFDRSVEWLLVDNGSRPGDRQRFARWGWKVLEPGVNTGYAAGVNRGVEESSAPILVLLNPDVLVQPGCLGALISELRAGADVVGPRFYWDRGCRLLLPPNEPRTRRWEIAAARALASEAEARRVRRLWRQHALRHWQAAAPLETPALSGALLALSREAWQRAGPFDSGFRLYFEETDWLERLRRQGGCSRLVPEAEAVHLYNQSGAQEERTGEWFEASRRRFFRRHYGRWFLPYWNWRQSRRMGSAKPAQAVACPAPLASPAAEVSGSALPTLEIESSETRWIEISPRREGFPAGAQRWEGGADPWQLPADVCQGMAPGTYWIRLVSEKGEEEEVYTYLRR